MGQPLLAAAGLLAGFFKDKNPSANPYSADWAIAAQLAKLPHKAAYDNAVQELMRWR